MDIEDIDFLSRSKISELRVMVNNFVIMDKAISSSGRRLTPIEKAELLESLGTMEFYEGNWHQSVQSFRPSLTEFEETHSRRNPQQLVSSFILFGIALFRLGELQNALDVLEKAAKIAKEGRFPALAAKALSNCAVICSKLNRLIDAISFCRQAIESSAEVNHVGSFDHLQYARILIQCYIKIRDYEKAENVVESFLFSKEEKILLMGGIFFAAGSLVKAGEILFKLIGSQNQPSTTGKRPSSISSDDIEKAIDHIENDLEQWSVAESKTEQDSFDNGSDTDDPEIIQKRQEEENENIVKIERIVERAITLYNSSLFMPPPPPVDKTQRLQNAKSGAKEEAPTKLTATTLQQNFHQGQRLQQLAMDSLKLFVRKLRKRRSQAYDDRKYDAFERVPWNFYPEVLSYDLYMYPAVCWAVLLQANAERYLQDSLQFHQGLRIQRGEIVLSTEDYQEQFEATETFFSKAIQVVEAARFHGGFETVDDDSPARRTKSIAPKNSVFGDEESIKAAAANLAAAFGEVATPASATSKSSVAVPAKEGGSAKSRHTSVATRPSKRGSTQSTISPSRRATKAGEPVFEAKEEPVAAETASAEAERQDAETVIAKMTGMDLQLVDTVDTSLLKDALLNVKQLISMDSDLRTNRMVVSAANKSLVRQGVTEFNPWTGQLGNNMLPSIFPTTNTGAKDERPSNVVGQIRDPTSLEKKGAVQITYKPKQEDPLSIRSEMIPTRSTFGMDEEISWIHWALGAVGGISLGFLGHSCMSAEELIACITADNEPRRTRNDSLNESAQQAGPRLPESFLVEVRNRLLEVDTKLTLSDEIDVAGEEDITMSGAGEASATTDTAAGEVENVDPITSTSSKKRRRGDYLLSLPSGQLETRLILLFVLVKVTAELHWKKELLPSLLQLEKTYEILRQRYGASIAYRHELLIYGAMVYKFRLEYDQWLMLSSEVMSDGERAEVLMLNILPRAKKYHQAAIDMMSVMQALNNNPSDPMGRDCGQLYLMKDAVRKLSNTYIAIGNIPVKVTATQASYGGKKKQTDAPTAPPAVQPLGTMEEFERFSEKDVEDREKNDIKWLQKFGRVRAQVVYKKYKEQFGNNATPMQMQGGANAATVVVSF